MLPAPRKFSAEFKLRAVRQVEAGASVAAVARRHEIHPTLLSKWRQQLRRDPERAFQRDREPNDEQVLHPLKGTTAKATFCSRARLMSLSDSSSWDVNMARIGIRL